MARRSLVAHLLWELDAPFPNAIEINTAIKWLRAARFARVVSCGPICGPGDAMIQYATLCD
jgi:hypothetical protein